MFNLIYGGSISKMNESFLTNSWVSCSNRSSRERQLAVGDKTKTKTINCSKRLENVLRAIMFSLHLVRVKILN